MSSTTHKNSSIRIASLNARSIIKLSNPTIQRQYAKHLRSRDNNYDILCLQEVVSTTLVGHLSSDSITILQHLFPTSNSIFTKYCAIICINPRYTLCNEFITIDERCITASV
ncbi:hypothetical protein BDB01DRAFT_733047, partial [Pilobolus umbonatus]